MSTCAGIDIGSDAIKGIVLRAGKTGQVEVVAAGTMPIADLTRMAESPDRALAIGEKLRELVRSTRLNAQTRRVGAAGGKTSIRYLQIPPVPPWRLDMLVKYEVEERSEEKEANACDYHIMDVPETSGNYTVIIGMCRESYCTELLGQAKAGGLGEVEIDLEALALYSAYFHGHGFDPDKTVAIADIGADDLTVLLCKNGTLYYARTLLGGGRRFTQNLADDLKLEWPDAEELKKNVAEITFEASPSASSTGRPRAARTGGTLSIPRGGVPVTAQSGIQAGARSGVLPVPGGQVPGGGAEETRRARVPDGAKLTRPGAPGASGSQTKPAAGAPSPAASGTKPAGASGSAPASASGAKPSADPAQTQKLPAPRFKSGGEVDFSVPSLEDLDLDTQLLETAPPPPKPAAPAPVAPVAPSAPVPPVTASKPAPSVDEFELQPIEDDVKPALKNGGPKPPAAAQPAGPPPPAPAPTAAPDPDIIDLIAFDDVKGAADAALAPSASAVSSAPEDKDRRKRQITAALVREAASLCASIENVLMNARQQAKQPNMKLDRLYITGGGSKLKGLPEFMGRRLRVEVAMFEPLRNISLAKLSAAQADALRAEQRAFGVALGLALSDLRKGVYSFALTPKAVKDAKEFWARGAYHYYAAAAAALALGVLVYTPYSNTNLLNKNYAIADEAYRAARTQNEGIRKQEKDNSEYRHRLITVTDNVQSGDYFLNLLAELKSTRRIQEDIYLTSISTQMPYVVIAEAQGDIPKGTVVKGIDPSTGKEPDTFQAQRRVYLRGFARGKRKEDLIAPIQSFYDKLVPYPNDPDHADNLFKDIRGIWYSKEDNQSNGYYLKEFVLEAYTAGASAETLKAEEAKKANEKKKAGRTETAKPAVPAKPEVFGHAAPVNPARSVGPIRIIPGQPLPPELGGQPVQPAQPNVSAKPAFGGVVEHPAVIPAQPAVPIPVPVPVPAQPAVVRGQPVQPQPAQPVPQPAQPVQPVPQPAQPVKPAQPIPPIQQPALPVQPVQPVLPAQPVQPLPPVVKKKPEYVVPDEAPVPAPK